MNSVDRFVGKLEVGSCAVIKDCAFPIGEFNLDYLESVYNYKGQNVALVESVNGGLVNLRVMNDVETSGASYLFKKSDILPASEDAELDFFKHGYNLGWYDGDTGCCGKCN